ncbi:MAG: thioredoxin domain-containing protein [Chloroflexota bacterium]
MANRLAGETSPYLLQHKDNPVDWYPWGAEALERARHEDKPILLSIGYSACHWCHVMAHESFENQEIAAVMNERFINIKVDREERPDLDAIYMDAVQAMTGHGGWPMTMFLTPDGEPFFGGTYFPPREGRGMPSFPSVLLSVWRAYTERRDDVRKGAQELREFLSSSKELPPPEGTPTVSVLDEATRTLIRDFDRVRGGTVGAPKFPQPMNIEFLLKQWRRTGDRLLLELAELTLEKMAFGGIYDQVGGGFHRYSVDDVWLVPHFEKMLYDNALLARLYLSGYQATGKPLYRRIAEETLDYIAREMTSKEGGFYTAQDADSEGVEGKFYVWSPDQITALLGEDDGTLFNSLYDVTPSGNFDGQSILHLDKDPETFAIENQMTPDEILRVVRDGKEKLYAARAQRVHPGTDDKLIMSWNGLMTRAFAEAACILDSAKYLQIAVANAQLVTSKMQTTSPEGEHRWFRTYKDARAHIDAFAEDYAAYANALISVYEATFDPEWLRIARSMIDTLISHFWDDKDGGVFSTSDYHETLVSRPKDFYDNAVPSANSEAAEALLRLYLLTANSEYETFALRIFQPFLPALGAAPTSFGRLLSAIDFYLSGPAEVALIGPFESDAMQELVRATWRPYAPNKVVAGNEPKDNDGTLDIPLLENRPMLHGKAAAYVCRNYICEAPTSDPREVVRLLTSRPADNSVGIDV